MLDSDSQLIQLYIQKSYWYIKDLNKVVVGKACISTTDLGKITRT